MPPRGFIEKLRDLDTSPVPGKFPAPTAVHLAGPDDKACPLYVSRLIRGIKNGPSPQWLRDRLSAIGLRLGIRILHLGVLALRLGLDEPREPAADEIAGECSMATLAVSRCQRSPRSAR